MFGANSKENTSTSNQESLCLPNPSLLATPSLPQPMARISEAFSQSFPGGLWVKTTHSTPGKGKTFALIPSPQPGPQNTLAAPSRVLQSALLLAEQRSGLSPFSHCAFLVPVCFWHQQQPNWPEQQLTCQPLPQGSTLYLSKEEQQLVLSPRTPAAPLPAQEETQDIAKPLISSTVMFIRGQVQQQSTRDKLLGLFPTRTAAIVFREAVLDQISPS